jgi:hypothetical protein
MEGKQRLPVTFGIRLSVAHAEQLRQLAESDDRAPTAVARRFIVRALEETKNAVPSGATQ